MFLILHSLLPHEHNVEKTETLYSHVKKESTDFFQFLKLTFQLDMGEGHLEVFNSTNSLVQELDSSTLKASICLTSHEIIFILLEEKNDIPSSRVLEPPLNSVPKIILVRGPPLA